MFIRIVAFVSIFLVLFVFISYLLRPVYHNREMIGGFYAEKTEVLDVVYIGGSVCFVSWAPLQAFREQGIASYNYACDSMLADTIKYSIKEILKTQSPDLFIIDARPFQYRDSLLQREVPIRNLSDSMPYSFNRTAMLLNVVPKGLKEIITDYNFDISKYHENWKNISKSSYEFMQNKKKNMSKGFYFIPLYMSVDTPSDKESITGKAAPSQETNDIFADLLEFCTDENLTALFVVAPYVETVEQRMQYNYLGDKIKLKGFDFVNFNDDYDEIGIDFSKDFYNNDHLNIFGAEKYTKYLGQYLTNHYNLPDRRKDSNYADWKELLPEWDKKVDSVKNTVLQLME